MAYVRFIARILRHKWYVLWFGLQIGGIPLLQLIMHDMTKFSRAEFMPRFRTQVLKFPEEREEWQATLDHHWSRNTHHWNYWARGGVPLPMSEVYVREMVADWLSAQKTYGGSLQEWIAEEYPKMRLHPETVTLLVALLASQGIWIRSKKTMPGRGVEKK
ncbi:MAG: hypothetical protein UY70_C0017G0005 [Candidatus Kaiserbacteria bacterium GW2011_GWB1_52_6]|uniref:Uncharacterized protein n=2 Tax=Candidatus Kaiseribacteriota TaxID=1752734 RepID=A0A0G1XKF4_9BACT|nr:MAG: hypothetical protein UY70_C0017G0005 [Candidatus Kaiserbacteria bacterium GW2011_GWB1_52_6]KKW31360.1 MAG: hypothetical protein UY74_C0016G0017 [Candidatus Kaiserbacteria bacterium GW2011_GWC2_52_8b]